jgi:hypothetical protein
MCTPNQTRSRYGSLWERLIANTHEPSHDNGCWLWKSSKKCRFGYGRFNFYVPMLGASVTLSAHVAMFALAESSPATPDEFYLEYLNLRCCGLELDHGCDNESCINPDHLRLMTHIENNARKFERKEYA